MSARQAAAAVGVRTCRPWETAATLPSACRRRALRRPRGRKGAGTYRGGRPPAACLGKGLTLLVPRPLELKIMEVVVTTGAIRRAKLQSNHHHQQTNTQFLQAGCLSGDPKNSVRALNGKLEHLY